MWFAMIVVSFTVTSDQSFEARMAREDALLAERRHELWVSEREAWQRIISMNEARFGEGVIPERDLIQARVEGGLLDLEVSESQLELEAARRRFSDLSPEGELPVVEKDSESGFPPLPRDKLRAGSEIAKAASEYETARDQIQTFQLRLLAACEESASIEELLYEQLKTGLLTLLEARRTCRAIRLRYAEALYRAEASRLQLRRLLKDEAFLP